MPKYLTNSAMPFKCIIHTHYRSFTGTRWSKCCYNWRNSEAKNVPSDWPQWNDRTAGNTRGDHRQHAEGQLFHALLQGVWYVQVFQQTIINFQLLSNQHNIHWQSNAYSIAYKWQINFML